MSAITPSNPRGRNQVAEGSANTVPAKMPPLVRVRTGDAALDALLAAVCERLEVYEGARDNPQERVLRVRDIPALAGGGTVGGNIVVGSASGDSGTGVGTVLPPGYAEALRSDFENLLRNSKLYRDLMLSLDDPTRFDDLPEQVRAILLSDLAAEAKKLGASVSRVEELLQTATRSFAQEVRQVTAAVDNAQSGVRTLTFASANRTRALAGSIRQIEAKLEDVGGVTIEEVLQAIADQTKGLRGQYTLKIQAGEIVAGIGLAAEDPIAGPGSSAFMVRAHKFAILGPDQTVDDPANPPLASIPFGVDAATGRVYINGSLYVNANGQRLQDIGRGIALATTSRQVKVSDSTLVPASITLTASFTGGITGSPIFQVTQGQATLTGSGMTRTLATSSMTSDLVVIEARITVDGVTYAAQTDITRVKDGADGNTQPGTPGPRGSIRLYANGSSWSDTIADNAIFNATGSFVKTIGDEVTISNGSTFAQARYWSGTAWVTPGAVIDGNLLVRGTVSGDTLAGGTIDGVTIKVGPQSPYNQNARAFQVTSTGVVLVDNLFAGYIVANPGSNGSTPAIQGSTPGNYPAILGSTNAPYNSSQAHGVQARNNTLQSEGILACSAGQAVLGIINGYDIQNHAVQGVNRARGSGGVIAGGSGVGPAWDFYATGGNGLGYGPFTGAHDALVTKGTPLRPGTIVVDVACKARAGWNNTIFEVAAADRPNQKGVVGVVQIEPFDFHECVPVALAGTSIDEDGNHDDGGPGPHYYECVENYDLLCINAVGEGQVLVNGEGGDLEPGDFITTSSTAGIGMKQADDLVRGFTVAKCREHVSFADPSEEKIVAAIFLCG